MIWEEALLKNNQTHTQKKTKFKIIKIIINYLWINWQVDWIQLKHEYINWKTESRN